MQQNQPPESSVQGQYQIGVPQGIPSPATAGSSQQVLVQREEGDPFKMPLRELSVQGQVLYSDALIILQYIILTVQNVPTALYQR